MDAGQQEERSQVKENHPGRHYGGEGGDHDDRRSSDGDDNDWIKRTKRIKRIKSERMRKQPAGGLQE